MAGLGLPIASLSGGNQQKALPGRLIATKPRVLILNDPMRGVDLGAKSELYDVLANLAASGVSILLLSTELVELCLLCDRVVVFHDHAVSAIVERDALEERTSSTLCLRIRKAWRNRRRLRDELDYEAQLRLADSGCARRFHDPQRRSEPSLHRSRQLERHADQRNPVHHHGDGAYGPGHVGRRRRRLIRWTARGAGQRAHHRGARAARLCRSFQHHRRVPADRGPFRPPQRLHDRGGPRAADHRDARGPISPIRG